MVEPSEEEKQEFLRGMHDALQEKIKAEELKMQEECKQEEEKEADEETQPDKNRIITSAVGGGFIKKEPQAKPMPSVWDFLKEKL